MTPAGAGTRRDRGRTAPSGAAGRAAPSPACSGPRPCAAIDPRKYAKLGFSKADFVEPVSSSSNAAGYDAGLASPNSNPLRAAIRASLAKRTIPSLAALKVFFEQHRRTNDTAELSQYISFALTAGGPPDFAVKMREVDIPPDVTPLLALSPLLAAFYKEAGIEELWAGAQPAIDQMIAPYHAPASEAVLQINAYLRQPTSGFRGRHFQIFVEPLAAPNQVHSRSYGNEYTIVVTPSASPRLAEVRQAYLYYLLDPLATRNEEILNRKKPLAEHAQRARMLGDAYKRDFLLLTTGSLVRAVEARMDHQPQAVQDALREGYILAPYFFEALQAYEKQELSMILYYTSMVQAIDLYKEDTRLTSVQFNKPEAAPPVTPAAPAPPAAPPAFETLKSAEQLLKDKELEKAEKQFQLAIQQAVSKSQQAAGYYGLARIALAQDNPDDAETLLEQTLELEPEASIHAWALVYLGKLKLEVGDRGNAARYFQDALKVEGASDLARTEAQKGLQQISK
jgi:predicted negative regulator of RcsB-dependent stress response